MDLSPYKPFLKLLRPYRKQIVLAAVCGTIFGASSGAGLPFISEFIFKGVLENPDDYSRTQIVLLALSIPGIFLLRGFFGFSSGFIMAKVGIRFISAIKNNVFEKLQELDLAFFDRSSRGDLLTKVNQDTTLMSNSVLDIMPELLRQPFQMIFALGFLIYKTVEYQEYSMILFFLIIVPLCLAPAIMIGRNLRRRTKQMMTSMSTASEHIWENFNALEEIRAYKLEKPQRKGFLKKIEDMLSYEVKIKKYLLMQQPSMEIPIAFVLGCILVYSYYSNMTFPTFSALGIALYMAIDPIKRLSKLLNNLQQYNPNAVRIHELLQTESKILDPEEPVELNEVRGDLTFKKMCFGYEDEDVLHDIELKINAGTNCALVGHSGSGKSTFVKIDPALL